MRGAPSPFHCGARSPHRTPEATACGVRSGHALHGETRTFEAATLPQVFRKKDCDSVDREGALQDWAE